jgi:hypothetical protein
MVIKNKVETVKNIVKIFLYKGLEYYCNCCPNFLKVQVSDTTEAE